MLAALVDLFRAELCVIADDDENMRPDANASQRLCCLPTISADRRGNVALAGNFPIAIALVFEKIVVHQNGNCRLA